MSVAWPLDHTNETPLSGLSVLSATTVKGLGAYHDVQSSKTIRAPVEQLQWLTNASRHCYAVQTAALAWGNLPSARYEICSTECIILWHETTAALSAA